MCIVTPMPNHERVYVTHADDEYGVMTLRKLASLGARTATLTGMRAAHPHAVCLFSSPHTGFKNKHVRVLTDKAQAAREGFHVPSYRCSNSSIPFIALDRNPHPHRESGLADFLRQLHYAIPGGYVGPKKSKLSRAERKFGAV